VAVDPAIKAVAALDDDLRRGMYQFIRAERRPVSRDEAAAAVGISRKLAAFHLDKLVDAGVLRAHFGSATGIRRVGRAPKVYEPVDTDLQISIPPRRLDLLADILLTAVLAPGPASSSAAPSSAALEAATERGRDLGETERRSARPGRLGAERALTLVTALLTRHGFEPVRAAPSCVRLHSCPFHPLADRAPDLVCAINQAFVAGVIEGLDPRPSIRAVLDPREGDCCVELRARA
jgi:predicted ArsR family transcriptional regulator